jgi:GNAT superfamily N-acetyltransferase
MVVRDARPADLRVLAEIKYARTMHADRIAASDGTALRYLVAESSGEVTGFACLVLAQPPSWPPMKHLPQIIDLTIRDQLRGRGLGTRFIAAMEGITRRAGHDHLIIGVAPDLNPRAHRLYQRLGYAPIEKEPIEDRWEYTDSEGVWHAGVERVVHLRKRIADRTGNYK